MIAVSSTTDLGAAIRKARKQLGLTQSQLAMAAGAGVRFIGDLENGKPTVELGRALTVIQALGGVMTLVDMPLDEGQSHGA